MNRWPVVIPLRRLPWGDVVGALAACLFVVLAFSPILFGGRTLSPAGHGLAGVNGTAPFPGQPASVSQPDYRFDVLASPVQFEPWAKVIHRSYSQGELPLWNPYQAAGAPLAANMQSAAFDPLLAVVNLQPSTTTWDYSIIGAFMLGAVFTYLFGRVIGLEIVPSVAGSAAFSLGGYFFIYSNNHFSRSYLYLPLIFLLVELVLRSPRVLPVIGLGLAVAGNIYLGMPESSFFVLTAGAVYSAARVLRDERHGSRAALRLAAGFGLGLVLAAPLLLLFQQYEALSYNTHKAGSGDGTFADPLRTAIDWVVPYFGGHGPKATSGTTRDWCGGAVAMAALVGLSGRTETARRHAWVFFAIAVGLLLKLLDLHVLSWLGRLPVLNRLQFLFYATPVAGFAIAMLAAVGVQVLWKRDLHLKRFALMASVALLVLVAIVLVDSNWDQLTKPSTGYSIEAWVRAAVGAVGVIVAALLVHRGLPKLAGVLATGLIAAELINLAPMNFYQHRADQFAHRPGWLPIAQQVLQREPEGRVFAVDARLFPDTAGALGLQDIRAVDALYVARYWRYIKTFISPGIRDRFAGGPYTSLEGIAHYQNNPMLDALAVRLVLSQVPIPIEFSNTHAGLVFWGEDPVGQTFVYENIAAYPRAWVVHSVHSVGNEDAAFSYLRARGRRDGNATLVDRFDPRREAVIEQNGPDASLAASTASPPSCASGDHDRVTISAYTSNSVRLKVDAACAGLLVLPDTYFPGWVATVNGHTREIHPADGMFRSVAVPAGTSEVKFAYRPGRFRLGVMLALLGILGAGVAAAIPWARRRKSRRCAGVDSSEPLTPETTTKVG